MEPVFAWQDDGPLASPDLFDGFWTTWRDTDNHPLAVYGVSDACEDTGSFVCDEETAQVEEAKKARQAAIDEFDVESGSMKQLNAVLSPLTKKIGDGKSFNVFAPRQQARCCQPRCTAGRQKSRPSSRQTADSELFNLIR